MSMSTLRDADLREQVHTQLTALCAPGGPLALGSALDTSALHELSPGKWELSRLRLHADLLDPYRVVAPGGTTAGRCAIATAGPPGAGKTWAVNSALGELIGWRRIDADVFKQQLIEHAVATDLGTYGKLLRILLPDGQPVAPMELAGLFHVESTRLAARALRLCLGNGEDVVIEGTLQWDGLVAEYSKALGRAGYDSLTVIDVATPLPVALERAKTRWWQGRLAGGMGGRFTPPDSIARMYDIKGNSVCAANARALVEATTNLGVSAVLETVTTTPPAPEEDNDLTA